MPRLLLTLLLATLLALIVLLLCPASYAQVSLNVQIIGGPLTLTIDDAVAGGEPFPDADDTRRIEYFVDAGVIDPKKITVETSCPGQRFTLRVEAQGVNGGTSAGVVTLQDSAPPQDFIRDMLPIGVNGGANLAYSAQSLMSQGFGEDLHLITYTLVEQ